MVNKNSKIYVAGHLGMVGSACWNLLIKKGYNNLLGRSSNELDLRNQKSVNNFIKLEKPDIIIVAAAKVGGILANASYPYEFLLNNMLIQNNIIDAAHKFDVNKLIFLGSSCIYPKFAKQPIKEEYLLSDRLEPTNECYALAKITGIKLIEALRLEFKRDYVALMPTNLYGPNDNYDLKTSHVLPAMIRKFHEAKLNHKKTVNLWGSGKPKREFMHVDDLASAVIFAMESSLQSHIYNIGTGLEISIKDLASNIKSIVGYDGKIYWDINKPDGTPRKLIDSSKIRALGWKSKVELKQGIINTYKDFLENQIDE